MSKKERITFQQTSDLEAIDGELTVAMEHLEETNKRIVDLLGSFEPEETAAKNARLAQAAQPEQAPAESAETTAADNAPSD